jgi:hypothetical protein
MPATVTAPRDTRPMELRDWIIGEHESVRTRFERSISAIVPPDRWRDPAGAGGSSIAYLLFHATYHADLAVGPVLAGESPRIEAWRDRLGLDRIGPSAGLGETEDPGVSSAVDVDALRGYADAVHDATTAWVGRGDLDAVVDGSAALERSGVSADDVPWLHSMWSGQPATFFLQWEAIGHRVNHVGEMVSVRNRLGLSPF